MKTDTHRPNLKHLLLVMVMTSYSNVKVDALTTIQPLRLDAFVGDSVTFECSTDDTSYLPWQWFKVKGTTVLNIALENKFTLAEYELIVGEGSSKVTQLNVSIVDDKNRYYCQYGAVSKMATLTVISPVGLESKYPQCDVNTTSANTGKLATFTCNASGGNPQPSLQWYDADNIVEQNEFVCYDNMSYCAQFQYILSAKDEGKIFNCKAEGTAVRETQSCSANLRIPPSVIVSIKSTDADSLDVVCSAETPWGVVDYQWFVNSELLESTQLQFRLQNNGRILIISDLNTNHAEIEIGCNVTTVSGLVGSDVISYIGDIKERCDISLVILIICFSVAVLGAFIVGICISKVLKSKNISQNVNTIDKLKELDDDGSHEYETILLGDKPATAHQTTVSGYSIPKKTKVSKYKEINPSPIDLEHSEYMSSEA